MDFLLDALTNWLKEMLVGGIMGNLSGMFDSVNTEVGEIATQVGTTPAGWNRHLPPLRRGGLRGQEKLLLLRQGLQLCDVEE